MQLLEFLVKNGSERVIDDARSHLSLLKMLRQFQFLDQNGKDQGINVRNRAKELADLLSDVDRIRQERKKARSNRNKFGGVEGGSGFSGGMSSGSRYGGFGSEDAGFGGYSGQVYGDGGGFGGNTSSFQDSGRRDKFEEYDEGDDQTHTSTRSKVSSPPTSRRKAQEPPKPKEPEVDLFEFGDDDIPPATPPKPVSIGKQPATSALDDDDDFGDFNSAAPEPAPARTTLLMSPPPQSTNTISSSTQFAQPTPVSSNQNASISNIMSTMSPAPSAATPSAFSPPTSKQPAFSPPAMQPKTQPTGYQAATPNYFTSVPAASAPSNSGAPSAGKGGLSSAGSFGAKPAAEASGGDAFGSLWSSASATAGIKKAAPASGPNLASLAQQKTSQGIWGPSKTPSAGTPGQSTSMRSPPTQTRPQAGGGLDDLLG